ncbi:tyrosine-type recombinase/integrase [Neotabrizicola sp. sgz301269]|uniref:tyrosine-type recombinase/integrase n=1 Tax=Neotabrizicola sp. sgz301269 TaxID=3276282 RepID=UPI003770535E
MTLTNILPVTDKTGKTRRYLRVKGQKLVKLPDLPTSHPEFIAAWSKAMQQATGHVPKPQTGTLAKLCQEFTRSHGFKGLSETYQSALLRHIDKIEAKGKSAMVAHLRQTHIRQDLAPLLPGAAQTRLKAWRRLMRFALDMGYIETDPSAGIDKPKMPKSDGHPRWTADEIDAFRARWPIGSVSRAIFELIYWTGARISDAVKIGPGMVSREGVLIFKQTKTGDLAYVPWTCPLPIFALESDRAMMLEAIRVCQGHMAFLATKQGRPRSAKAIGGDVSHAAREAGIGKSAHGLRKSRATDLFERGAPTNAVMAWTGHQTLAEAEHYTREFARQSAVVGRPERNGTGTVEKLAAPVAKSGK